MNITKLKDFEWNFSRMAALPEDSKNDLELVFVKESGFWELILERERDSKRSLVTVRTALSKGPSTQFSYKFSTDELLAIMEQEKVISEMEL